MRSIPSVDVGKKATCIAKLRLHKQKDQDERPAAAADWPPLLLHTSMSYKDLQTCYKLLHYSTTRSLLYGKVDVPVALMCFGAAVYSLAWIASRERNAMWYTRHRLSARRM